MKRLTISMSDDLFERLDTVENKSLFIRRLIERELEGVEEGPADEVVEWTDRFSSLRNDVGAIFNRLELIEKNMSGLKPTSKDVQKLSGQSEPDEMIIDGYTKRDPSKTIPIDITESADATVKIENHSISDTVPKETIPKLNIEKDNPEAGIEYDIETMQNDQVADTTKNILFDDLTERNISSYENKIDIQSNETDHEIKLSELVAEKYSKPETTKTFHNKDSSLPLEQNSIQNKEKLAEALNIPKNDQSSDHHDSEERATFQRYEQEEGTIFMGMEQEEGTKADKEVVMPKLKVPETKGQEERTIFMGMEQEEGTKADKEVVMPKLKVPETRGQEEGTKADHEVLMPGFQPQPPSIEYTVEENFLKMNHDSPPPKLPEMQHINVPKEDSPFMATENDKLNGEKIKKVQSNQPGAINNTQQKTTNKQDKLEGNILMYMPRGAKVKKEIIKSLVSRQFTKDEVESKIKDLIKREILAIRVENDSEHLHRLK